MKKILVVGLTPGVRPTTVIPMSTKPEKAKLQIYLLEAEAEHWKACAERAGLPLSQWVVEKVRAGTIFMQSMKNLHQKIDLLIENTDGIKFKEN